MEEISIIMKSAVSAFLGAHPDPLMPPLPNLLVSNEFYGVPGTKATKLMKRRTPVSGPHLHKREIARNLKNRPNGFTTHGAIA